MLTMCFQLSQKFRAGFGQELFPCLEDRSLVVGFRWEGFSGMLWGSEHPWREQPLDAAAGRRAAVAPVSLPTLRDAGLSVLSSGETNKKKGILVSISLVS